MSSSNKAGGGSSYVTQPLSLAVQEIEEALTADIRDSDLARLLKATARHLAEAHENGRCMAYGELSSLTATEVMIVATILLKAANVQLFELGLWQTFSGARSGN